MMRREMDHGGGQGAAEMNLKLMAKKRIKKKRVLVLVRVFS